MVTITHVPLLYCVECVVDYHSCLMGPLFVVNVAHGLLLCSKWYMHTYDDQMWVLSVFHPPSLILTLPPPYPPSSLPSLTGTSRLLLRLVDYVLEHSQCWLTSLVRKRVDDMIEAHSCIGGIQTGSFEQYSSFKTQEGFAGRFGSRTFVSCSQLC